VAGAGRAKRRKPRGFGQGPPTPATLRPRPVRTMFPAPTIRTTV